MACPMNITLLIAPRARGDVALLHICERRDLTIAPFDYSDCCSLFSC